MLVTDIIEISKKKYKIMVDYEFAFVLYKGELPLYKIKKDEPIAEGTYRQIVDEVLTKRAKIRAMNLLKSHSYTEKKLAEKLKRGLYPQSCIQCAVEYVKSYGYVNDDQYAADYMFYHGNRLNRVQLFQKLREKGVSDEIIIQNYESYCRDHHGPKEEELICDFLRKKGYRRDMFPISAEQKSKWIRALIQRGFAYDKICHVFANYGENAEEMYE